MKRIVVLFLMVLAFFSSCAQDKATALTPQPFSARIQQDSVQVLDVRTTEEFRSGHVLQAMQADWNKPDEFNKRIQSLDKNKPVYVYCLSGGRSAAAAKKLRQEGFREVVNMSGGIMAWKKEQLPLTVAANTPGMSYATLQEKIAASPLVLVDIGATWCPPCRKMAPLVQQLVANTPGLTLIPVDASSATEIVKALEAEEIPVFILYRNGRQVWRKSGILSYEDLRQAVGK